MENAKSASEDTQRHLRPEPRPPPGGCGSNSPTGTLQPLRQMGADAGAHVPTSQKRPPLRLPPARSQTCAAAWVRQRASVSTAREGVTACFNAQAAALFPENFITRIPDHPSQTAWGC